MADATTTTTTTPPASDTGAPDTGGADDAVDSTTDFDATTDDGAQDDTDTDDDTADKASGTDGATPTAADLAAELERLKEQSRRWEDRSKRNERRARENEQAAEKLREIQREQMSEHERAVDDARAAGRAEALEAMGKQLVAAQFRVAAAGRLDAERVERLVGAVDLGRFMDNDGSVLNDDIAEFVEGIAPPPPATNGTQDVAALLAQFAAANGGNGTPTAPPAPADLGQGAGRTPPSLNGDPLLDGLKQALGIR